MELDDLRLSVPTRCQAYCTARLLASREKRANGARLTPRRITPSDATSTEIPSRRIWAFLRGQTSRSADHGRADSCPTARSPAMARWRVQRTAAIARGRGSRVHLSVERSERVDHPSILAPLINRLPLRTRVPPLKCSSLEACLLEGGRSASDGPRTDFPLSPRDKQLSGRT